MTPSLFGPPEGLKSPRSVPVIVDDQKQTAGFDMTRCVYFHIDCEDTLDEWTMDLGSGETPFRMIGLSGVITRPFDQSPAFENPDQVGDLFDTAEKMLVRPDSEAGSMTYVELEEIWLPNKLLENEREEFLRGDVFRIGYDLFRLAFAFTIGRLTQDQFLHRDRALELRQIEFSEKETEAIRDWTKGEIEISAKLSQESELYLPLKRRPMEK
jgi:hypothetical protein